MLYDYLYEKKSLIYLMSIFWYSVADLWLKKKKKNKKILTPHTTRLRFNYLESQIASFFCFVFSSEFPCGYYGHEI